MDFFLGILMLASVFGGFVFIADSLTGGRTERKQRRERIQETVFNMGIDTKEELARMSYESLRELAYEHNRKLAENERRKEEAAFQRKLGELQYYLDCCESEPEQLFLEGLVREFSLTPASGTLVGKTYDEIAVKVQQQAEIGRYRVDFLINDKIIFEIDGRSYHSGDNDFYNDRLRDQNLMISGYIVARFPAKQIYSELTDCVFRVEELIKALAIPPV